jgi:hypothetical protein
MSDEDLRELMFYPYWELHDQWPRPSNATLRLFCDPTSRKGSSADGDILPEKAACSSMHYVTESSQFFSIGTYP